MSIELLLELVQTTSCALVVGRRRLDSPSSDSAPVQERIHVSAWVKDGQSAFPILSSRDYDLKQLERPDRFSTRQQLSQIF